MTSSSSNLERPGEFELIARLFAPLSSAAPGAFGLTDDVAVLPPCAGYETVLKTDAVVEGIHFLSTDPAALVAKKALRVNLSDLAAKGAEPAGYLLSLSIANSCAYAWLEDFVRGLAQDQKEFSVALLGGDTTSTPGPTTISITAIGIVPDGTLIRRLGARAGDLVFVSGTIGDAAAGLELLRSIPNSPDHEYLISRYRVPQPRLALGQKLRGAASASLDVSDGLIADLGHIAEVSQVRIAVDAARVPLSSALHAHWPASIATIVRAATAGDDYEIAFTVPAAHREAVLAAAAESSTPVTEIGRVETGRGIALFDPSGHEIAVPKAGYTHF